MYWKKIVFSVMCSLLYLVCAVILSDLALGLSLHSLLVPLNPFVLIGFGELVCSSLGPVCLIFGLWAVFLRPHRWWEHITFYLGAIVAGVWVSYSYQMFEWPVYVFQANLERALPTFQLVSTTTLVSCVIVLASAMTCAFAARHLLLSRRPNHALQQMAFGRD